MLSLRIWRGEAQAHPGSLAHRNKKRSQRIRAFQSLIGQLRTYGAISITSKKYLLSDAAFALAKGVTLLVRPRLRYLGLHCGRAIELDHRRIGETLLSVGVWFRSKLLVLPCLR